MRRYTPDEFRAAFWERVAPGPGCWIWSGSRIHHGYGRVKRDRRLELAHRVAWELVNGPVPDGLCVLHHCDNPPCVNPAHLFVGTNSDNILDAVAKGRAAHQSHPERVARGEGTAAAKLTAAQVIEIRQLHRPRRVSYPMLARRYGVSKQTIKNIVTGRWWRWLIAA